jgi:dolichol-phosphate mannosyltransferase
MPVTDHTGGDPHVEGERAPGAERAAPGEARPPTGPLVVLPTYEESANIRDALSGIRRALGAASVLVVDDEGGDGTADLAESVGRELGQIEVMRRSGKQGLAKAYIAGFRWGLDHGYDTLIGMDADLSHDATALPRLVQAIADGADVAVGSRYVPGGSTVNWPLSRRVLSRGGNWYASHLLATGVSDMTSAFRAYRAETLRQVDLAGLEAEGYGFLLELIHRCRQQGATVTEVPIVFADRVRGNSKMSPRIAVEAFQVVTRIGVRERLRRHR